MEEPPPPGFAIRMCTFSVVLKKTQRLHVRPCIGIWCVENLSLVEFDIYRLISAFNSAPVEGVNTNQFNVPMQPSHS